MTQVSSPDQTNSVVLAHRERRSAGTARLADYVALGKPRITAMVVLAAYAGFALGVGRAPWSWLTLAAALCGTALCCMAAAALNQLCERQTDALMERTRNRPLPAGRLTNLEALLASLGFAAVGTGVLCVLCHWLAAVAATFTILAYVLIYTPLKRVTALSTLVGAVPGAMPPVIGCAAATGRIGPTAWVLFGIIFVWQLPHVLVITWLYRRDFARAGLPVLPGVDPDGLSPFGHIVVGCLLLMAVGLLPTIMGMSGRVYFLTALVAGSVFLVLAVALLIAPTRMRARAFFLASLVYLPLVLTMMWIDQL